MKEQRTEVDDTESISDTEEDNSSYPLSIVFILAVEFFERFHFYGIKSILALYIGYLFHSDRETSKIILHSFIFVIYALSCIGAIVSDNYWGKFKAIIGLSLVYAVGAFLLAASGASSPNILTRIIALSGLFFIAITAGGIRALLPAFGGDQFTLPEQSQELCNFYQMYYFVNNIGVLFSSLLIPTLLTKISCNRENRCELIALLVPAISLTIAIIIFFSGRRKYIYMPKYGHMLAVYFHVITHAIANKRKSKEKRDHWLDYADDIYDVYIIDDLKVLCRIVILYSPCPIFWVFYYQQNTSWFLQAGRMTGDMGNWNISPEQWTYVNSLLILMLIPLFNTIVYPILSIIGIRNPLQRMVIGGFIGGVAFFIAGILEVRLEKTYPILPRENNAQVRIFNGELCDYNITTNIEGQEHFILDSLDVYTYRNINVPKGRFFLLFSFWATDSSCPKFRTKQFIVQEKTAYTIFLNSKINRNRVALFEDNVDKPSYGLPFGRVLANVDVESTVAWTIANFTDIIIHEEPASVNKLTEFPIGTYAILVEETVVITLTLKIGGSYTIVINEKDDGVYIAKIHLITEPNSIHMIWQLPQYTALATAEVMYTINGIEFSYIQAPVTMRSLIQACWFTSVGIGNGAITALSGIHSMKTSYEFFLFALILFTGMGIFSYLAYLFQPRLIEEK